jgi:hypothetical protein
MYDACSFVHIYHVFFFSPSSFQNEQSIPDEISTWFCDWFSTIIYYIPGNWGATYLEDIFVVFFAQRTYSVATLDLLVSASRAQSSFSSLSQNI